MKNKKLIILIIVISAMIVLGIGTTIVLCSGFLKTDDTDYEMAKQGFSDYFDIKSHVEEITSTFKDSNGYIEKENVGKTISTVGNYAKNLYEAKRIKDYEITGDIITILYSAVCWQGGSYERLCSNFFI